MGYCWTLLCCCCYGEERDFTKLGPPPRTAQERAARWIDRLEDLRKGNNWFNQGQLTWEDHIFSLMLGLYSSGPGTPEVSIVRELREAHKHHPGDVEFYLPQLCTYLGLQDYEADTVMGLVLTYLCRGDLRMAHKAHWYMNAFAGPKHLARNFTVKIEEQGCIAAKSFSKRLKRRRPSALGRLTRIDSGLSMGASPAGSSGSLHDGANDRADGGSPEHYHPAMFFVEALTKLSEELIMVPAADRQSRFREGLQRITEFFLSEKAQGSEVLYAPFGAEFYQIRSIHIDESLTFATKERVPLLICLEVQGFDVHDLASIRQPPNHSPPQNNSLESELMDRLRDGMKGLKLPSKRAEVMSVSPNHRAEAQLRGAGLDPPLLKDRAMSESSMGTLMGQWAHAPTAEDEGESHPGGRVFRMLHQVQERTTYAFNSGFKQLNSRGGSETEAECEEGSFFGAPIPARPGAEGAPGPLRRAPDYHEKEGERKQNLVGGCDSKEAPLLVPFDANDKQARGYQSYNDVEDFVGRTNEAEAERSEAEMATLRRMSSDDETARSGSDAQGVTGSRERGEHQSRVIFKERWSEKEDRIWKQVQQKRGGPPRPRPKNWCLMPVIVKSNDDLRQEQAVSQLLKQFESIFKSGDVGVYVRSYEILATSPRAGLIEAVPDTVSLHALKRNAPDLTLPTFFQRHFGPKGIRKARTNFVESAAAYAVICYLLQIKDRHNGNILLDSEGHLVHIDWGFVLGLSPGGNFGFESAPFKLTTEMVEVMGGARSFLFQRFRNLCVKAFLEVRRNREKIILLVEMMAEGNPDLPCFAHSPPGAVVEELRGRFLPGRNVGECIEFVNKMIDESMDNWRTLWYDKYQRLMVGIF
ncbi:unnamed protein product [Chrysoparadoxa australica]